MRSRLLPIAVLLSLGSSACVVHERPPPPPPAQPGNVSLLWRFSDGNTCATLAGQVDHMVVQIPGEALQNAGQFACDVAGTDGIQLNDFAAKTYSYVVDAVDSSGFSLYHAEGSFAVDGNVTVSAQLAPTVQGGGMAALLVRWDFLDANHTRHTCANEGVTSVELTLGNNPPATFPCTASTGVDGIDVSNLAPGTYQVTLNGLQGSGASQVTAYSLSQTVVLPAGQTSTLSADLLPLTGSFDLSYNFFSANCASSGVSRVGVSVRDGSGRDISGTSGHTVACADGASFHWDAFPAGTVTVQLLGFNAAMTQTWGALASTPLVAGGANSETLTLTSCTGNGVNGC